MKITAIDTGLFKLDGGAMFGVVPKTLWSKSYPADENNLCTWAMRCLLVEDGNRLILIDNGIGTKQDAKFFSYYFLHGEGNLITSINQAGYSVTDITDVFLTHLHFDHCGGGVKLTNNGTPELVFPNAKYWSHSAHWQWATQPNAREKASFLKENLLPMQESGALHFIDKQPNHGLPFAEILTVDGHTEKQMLPLISQNGQKMLYCADLLPSTAHLPIAWVMGYDTRPLLSLEEKSRILHRAAQENIILLLEHDAHNEAATVQLNERGQVVLKNTLKISELAN